MKKIVLTALLSIISLLVFSCFQTSKPYHGDLRKIAQNVRASTSQKGHLAGYAFDGDEKTRWSSEFKDHQWLLVDLGHVCDITKFIITWENAYAKKYEISVGTSKNTLDEIVTIENGQGGTERIKLKESVRGRYVKLHAIERGTKWGNSIYEFKIFGHSPVPLPEGGGLINYDLKRKKSAREQKIFKEHKKLLANAKNDPATSGNLNDTKFLRLIQKRAFNYFWYEAHPVTGLIPDKAQNFKPTWEPYNASVANSGFGLSAIPVGVENGWITRKEGYKRALKTLKFLRDRAARKNGFYYHFLKCKNGSRVGNSELSSIDSGLFLMGLITVMEYFDEPVLNRIGWKIYDRVDWQWMLDNRDFLSMGWKPESGFIEYQWRNMDEGYLLYFLALGSRKHTLEPDHWDRLERSQAEFKDYEFLKSGDFQSIFRFQYPLLWLELEDKHDDYANYFESSVNAVRACRQYCLVMSEIYPGYGPFTWGLGAAENIENTYKIFGFPPGSPQAKTEGTVVPYAIGGSTFLIPEIAIPSLRHIYDHHHYTWGKYGFADSFHPEKEEASDNVLGLDQGTILLGIENYLTNLPHRLVMKNPAIQRAFNKIGFTPEKQTSVKTLPTDLSGKWFFHAGNLADTDKINPTKDNWEKIIVPDRWENQGHSGLDGVGFYYRTFTLSKKKLDSWDEPVLHIGGIDDSDKCYVNGIKVGEKQGFREKRVYKLPPDLLREGKNRILIRVSDTGGYGGIWYRPVEIGPYMPRTWMPVDKSKSKLNF